jgi:hypothetical protein
MLPFLFVSINMTVIHWWVAVIFELLGKAGLYLSLGA